MQIQDRRQVSDNLAADKKSDQINLSLALYTVMALTTKI